MQVLKRKYILIQGPA
jgi:hypothetical protein